MTIEIDSIENIAKAAKKFVDAMGDEKVFSFEGNMGAGKTTFIKSICEILGVKEIVNSPTFAIVNEYETSNHETIYHFDCYRIENLSEAIDMGTEEYLFSGNVCFIEWAKNISPLLPETYTCVKITEELNGKRIVKMVSNNEI